MAQESSEFNLAYPTEFGYKFEVYDHIDPQIVLQSKIKVLYTV